MTTPDSQYLKDTVAAILAGESTNHDQLVYAASQGLPLLEDTEMGNLRLRLACLAVDPSVHIAELLQELTDALRPAASTPPVPGPQSSQPGGPPPMGASVQTQSATTVPDPAGGTGKSDPKHPPRGRAQRA